MTDNKELIPGMTDIINHIKKLEEENKKLIHPDDIAKLFGQETFHMNSWDEMVKFAIEQVEKLKEENKELKERAEKFRVKLCNRNQELVKALSPWKKNYEDHKRILEAIKELKEKNEELKKLDTEAVDIISKLNQEKEELKEENEAKDEQIAELEEEVSSAIAPENVCDWIQDDGEYKVMKTEEVNTLKEEFRMYIFKRCPNCKECGGFCHDCYTSLPEYLKTEREKERDEELEEEELEEENEKLKEENKELKEKNEEHMIAIAGHIREETDIEDYWIKIVSKFRAKNN